ncbi:histidine kinase [Odoribacter sp. OttesenSCG-928-G04]|nr:histidine kinase [Odoribacter sp. OttesenSCG-928-G04]MDL2331013.1 histidine kinase [Odoribacter sp. OttesenSCG-928-A06]
MLSTVVAYLSLILQVLAAIIAISLFKRTKYNVSWIMISVGFILMVVARTFELFPTFYPGWEDELLIAGRWLDFVISMVLLVGVFYIRKIFQFMRRVDEIRRLSEQKVLAAIIKTEEQERQRFANELHDGLGPQLSIIKMLISGLDSNKPSESNDRIKQNLKQSIDDAITCVRDISANISPHILNNFGLKEAIASIIKKLTSTKTVDIDFVTNINEKRFSYNTEVIMYRVVCELINNTLKHSEATEVSVSLQLREHVLYMNYMDNGIGFDVSRETTQYGMGLDNMQNRLRSGNGDIVVISERGKGMKAEAYIRL